MEAIRPLKKQNFKHPDVVEAELEGVVRTGPATEWDIGYLVGVNYAQAIQALKEVPGINNPLFDGKARPLTIQETIRSLVDEYHKQGSDDGQDHIFAELFKRPFATCSAATMAPVPDRELYLTSESERMIRLRPEFNSTVKTVGHYEGDEFKGWDFNRILTYFVHDAALRLQYMQICAKHNPGRTMRPHVQINPHFQDNPYQVPLRIFAGEMIEIQAHDMRKETCMLYRK